MSTSIRHYELVESFVLESGILRSRKKYELKTFSDVVALVHYGHRRESPHNLSLVDIQRLENLDILNNLYYVEPDFMLFQNNKYIVNDKRTRIAGYPDLAVEIWSDSNTQVDKEEKFLIYSSSSKTEHWYIEQDNNEVKCYLGHNQLQAQSLIFPLKTQNGLEFDLTHLAL
jgi:hypothetical protein